MAERDARRRVRQWLVVPLQVESGQLQSLAVMNWLTHLVENVEPVEQPQARDPLEPKLAQPAIFVINCTVKRQGNRQASGPVS